MSVTYNYEDKPTAPDTDQIHVDVAASMMTDKNIVGCRWDESIEILKVVWQESLSAEDKTLLDGIITDNT